MYFISRHLRSAISFFCHEFLFYLSLLLLLFLCIFDILIFYLFFSSCTSFFLSSSTSFTSSFTSSPIIFLLLFFSFHFFILLTENNLDSKSFLLPSSQALIIGKDDFLSIITSCIVCVMKSDNDLVNHLRSWGFLQAICICLKNALDHERRGEPVTCVMRILHQFVGASSYLT